MSSTKLKQNNHKVITVGQSPATWDRTHPRNLLQMTAKGKPGCQSPAFGKRSHTQKLQPISQTMSNQISDLISRYITNSTPQDTTQTNTQSYGLLRLRGDQATVLDFSPEKRWIRERRARRCRTAVDATRRRPVTAGGPTLRRTAALQTHATQHGRQRQRSRYRPTDSLQLPADQRPGTVDNVGGLVSARQTHFSSPG